MTEEPLSLPVLLTQEHEIVGFDCGKAPLNDFLIKYALQNQASYYSLAPASVLPADAPTRVMKGQGRYPVPVILMARFALDMKEQKKGYGRVLFRDALRRALAGAEAIGGRAFLVHAKDEEARAYYERFGMEASPTNPLHLFLLFKDVRKSLNGAQKKP
jgi:GNAT superfamily N-acetyltransferase